MTDKHDKRGSTASIEQPGYTETTAYYSEVRTIARPRYSSTTEQIIGGEVLSIRFPHQSWPGSSTKTSLVCKVSIQPEVFLSLSLALLMSPSLRDEIAVSVSVSCFNHHVCVCGRLFLCLSCPSASDFGVFYAL